MGRFFTPGLTVAALLAATGAFAADLPARTYTKAPFMVDPGIDWTGFYAGLNGGYSWGRANATIAPTVLPIPGFAPTSQNRTGRRNWNIFILISAGRLTSAELQMRSTSA